jgi:hypothetical protein
MIRTLTELEESGRYAWPGGYPVVYLDRDSSQLCYDCAKRDLESAAEGGESIELDSYVEQGDQQFYGGVYCDQCSQYIVEPCCPECGDEFAGKTRILHADNVDASELCLHCAAQLVGWRTFAGAAERIPGIGIRILKGDMHSPWYAPAGTVYRYACR